MQLKYNTPNITVVVETPKGSRQKFDFDPESGYLKLKKVMPAGLVFPFDFGFVPGTRGGDGDPVDVLVISELETFPGCALDCRIIGVLEVKQTERDGSEMRNDRFLVVPVVSAEYANVNTLGDLPRRLLDQLEHFFSNYNEQAGKKFEVLRRSGATRAHLLLQESACTEGETHMIQIFLPLYEEQGQPIPDRHFKSLKRSLIEKFGGLTAYKRSPAEGLWKADEGKTVQDDIVIYEVMAKQNDLAFWERLKSELLVTFKQNDILITCSRTYRI